MDDISSLHQNTWTTFGTWTTNGQEDLQGEMGNSKSPSQYDTASETDTTSTQKEESEVSQEKYRKVASLLRPSENKLRHNGDTSMKQSTKTCDILSKHTTEKSNTNDEVESGNTRGDIKDEVLKKIKKKMARVDQEQNSCLDQIKTMNDEMEAYRRNTLRQMKEKDDIIDLSMTEIAFLKQQMLQVKTEYQDHLSLIKTETSKVMRKLMAVQNQLKVVEIERDAAVSELKATKDGAAKVIATRKESGEQNEKPMDAVRDPSAASTTELERTVYDLMNQLEATTGAHQKERDELDAEIKDYRKRLERKEGECITLERERDDARQQIEIRNQLLELEKALHASAEKHHLEEINTWKSLYEQEVQFTPEKRQESAERVQKAAALLGNRLGKGILKGIQEDDNRSRASTATTVNTMDYDSNDAHYTNMMEYVVATKMLNMTLPSSSNNSLDSQRILEHASAPMMPSFDHTGTSSTFPTYIPEGSSSRPSSEAFQEAISIPNFLSKIW